MRRECEPEVMDTRQAAEVYDAMDHAAVNARFVDDLLPLLPPAGERAAGELLDLGTGTARIPLRLAVCRPDLRMVAVDLSASMLALAGRHVQRADLAEQIRLQLADAKQLPYADRRFGTVIANSLLHHLEQPGRAVAEAVRVTRPGGLLFFRDLLRPADEAALAALVATYTCGDPPSAQALFRDSLRAALTLEEIRGLVAPYGFPPESVQPSSDRHWTWVGQTAGGPAGS